MLRSIYLGKKRMQRQICCVTSLKFTYILHVPLNYVSVHIFSLHRTPLVNFVNSLLTNASHNFGTGLYFNRAFFIVLQDKKHYIIIKLHKHIRPKKLDKDFYSIYYMYVQKIFMVRFKINY